jgi:hypothetical protein
VIPAAFHDRIHTRHPDTGLDDLDADAMQDGVESRQVLGVAVPDQVSDRGSCVLEFHDQVAGGLVDPVGGGMGGGAQDADTVRGVLDDRQDIQACPRSRAGHLDPAAEAEALGGLVLTTHRGLEALAKAGVDAKTRNRIADAAIDSIALPAS